jgi:ABC-type polysaccharide/polyol phosphate transport system ATPase subunit
VTNPRPADQLAIRIRHLGRYFGAPIDIDGATRPREAMRALLRIAGVRVRGGDAVGPHVTVAAAGHVLRDLSLDVTRGSVVCLSGPAGSGKTVLLRLLAGVLAPTSGYVELYGQVSALLAAGDNLDARVSAYENILASPVIAGASPEDVDRYAAEVIEFAELHGFEHSAIRTYSTGMVLRLSVALALCGRPSIVLIDDVLAVGDIGFQQKCIDRVRALKELGSTLILAFSDEALIQQLATRVIVLAGGHIVSDTSPAHFAATAPEVGHAASLDWQVLRTLPEDDALALRSVGVVAGEAEDGPCLDITGVIEPRLDRLRCRPIVNVLAGNLLLFRSLFPEFVETRRVRLITFTVRVPIAVLPPGDYSIGLHVVSMLDSSVYSLKANDAVTLRIRGDERSAALAPRPALVLPLPWEVERVEVSA